MNTRAFAFAAALLVVPVTAMAAPNSVEVKYDDLDLSTAKGMKELDKRVDDAARQVCSAGSVTTGTILRSRAASACFHETQQKLHDHIAALTGQKQRG